MYSVWLGLKSGQVTDKEYNLSMEFKDMDLQSFFIQSFEMTNVDNCN